MAVEEPRHAVIEKTGAFELRRYEPMVLAEVVETGERGAAANAGFRALAGYIFGDNAPKTKIAMTAPVTQTRGEKIAMTAPVTQSRESGGWIVRFVMPDGATRASLPAPTNPAVRLVDLPGRTVAVRRFSGFATETALRRETDALNAEIAQRKLHPSGAATVAFYDPPWTLPFMRRNEVMLEIEP